MWYILIRNRSEDKVTIKDEAQKMYPNAVAAQWSNALADDGTSVGWWYISDRGKALNGDEPTRGYDTESEAWQALHEAEARTR